MALAMTHPFTDFSTALRDLARRATSSFPPPASVEAPVQDAEVVREMKCTRTDSATECRLQIEGSLDVHSAPEIRAVFDSVVAAKRELVVLELSGLTMLDSSGVGAIVSLFKRVKASGGCVVVKGVQAQPLAVCKLLKLDRVFGL
jgi:anti-sigma B factor antagonist